VCAYSSGSLGAYVPSLFQILQAVARKMIVSAEMDWDEIAESTEEFSGADLQALLYNAHLEVVQTSLSALTSDDKGKGREDEEPLEYTVLGMQDSDRVMTRAEEAALEKRVSGRRNGLAATRWGFDTQCFHFISSSWYS
jgi:SpoVK/Ycf46/Vps4 family AAA+-type ATPase